jgi:COP9 signalosome complex subunit 1
MDGDTTSLQSVTTFYQPKLRVALGLAHLAEGKYYDAAIIFTSLTIELNTQFATVISAEDIALYGSILGLATMDRELLHGCVIDGIFKGRLEVKSLCALFVYFVCVTYTTFPPLLFY